MNKKRVTFLACTNSDGSERLPPFVIGPSKQPRCFNGLRGWEYGLDYDSTKKAWMNRTLFYQWLCRFDRYVLTEPGRRVILLLDNCSAHGEIEILPNLPHVFVVFLPKNTTSKLQPLDAGVIASIKRRYKRRLSRRAVDLIDIGIYKNLYSIDLLLATKNVYDIWYRMESNIITNCWKKTGLITSTPCNIEN